MASISIEPINIRNIYGGASGRGDMTGGGSGGASAGDNGMASAAKAKEAGGGTSLMDMAGSAIAAYQFIKSAPGMLKKAASGVGRAATTAWNFGKDTAARLSKGAEAAGDFAKGTKTLPGAEKALSSAGKLAEAATKVEQVGAGAAKAGGLSGAVKAGGNLIGKAALPVTIIAASMDVLVNDRRIDSTGATANIASKLDGGAARLANQGVAGQAGAVALGVAGSGAVITAATVEETAKAGANAARVLGDSQAGVLEKAGAVLDVTAAPFRGAIMGTKDRVLAGVEAVGSAVAQKSVADGRKDATRMVAEKLSHGTHEQRVNWLSREQAALAKSTTLSPESRKAEELRLAETYKTAEETSAGTLPFGLPKAEGIPSPQASRPAPAAAKTAVLERK